VTVLLPLLTVSQQRTTYNSTSCCIIMLILLNHHNTPYFIIASSYHRLLHHHNTTWITTLLFASSFHHLLHHHNTTHCRYEGPKGSPGMPEMLSPGAALVGAGDRCQNPALAVAPVHAGGGEAAEPSPSRSLGERGRRSGSLHHNPLQPPFLVHFRT
jgi:hypothetical protein